MKAVFDCSNGTTGLVLEKVFAGARDLAPMLRNAVPDGDFPAHGPNPLATGALDDLSKEVKAANADCGAIFDADGDRVFFADDRGRKVEPAAAILMLAGRFRGDIALPVNIGPFVRGELAKAGRAVHDSRIGHYFLKKLMKEKQLSFAAEQSGHYYFNDFFGLDSGIFAALEFLDAVSELPEPLSAWIDRLPPHWISEEINFEVHDKDEAFARLLRRYSDQGKVSKLDGISIECPEWWCNVRASNTEPLVRLNLEATNADLYAQKFAELSGLLSGEK